jgi:KH domain-containing protein
MQEIYVEDIGRITANRQKLEKELDVRIENKGKNVFIEGEGDKEYITLKVIEAIILGFSIERALSIKNEEIIFQILNIKSCTRKRNLEEIKSRIIGTHGKTLRTINTLSNCFISLKDNQIGIIGDCEDIAEACQAIKLLIQGSKQSNVYAKLEKERKKKRLERKINLKPDKITGKNNNFISDEDEIEEFD